MALYCMPSFQNRTAALMSETRRREIAAVAVEQQLMVIEDDVCGVLAPDVKPLSSFLPDTQFFYITSTSKSIAQRATGDGRAGDQPDHRSGLAAFCWTAPIRSP